MKLYEELRLNGIWDLRDEILTYPLDNAHVLSCQPDGWIAQPVPGDIHQGLIDAGRIKEPLLGLNSFDCAWTEQRSWWFRKTFAASAEWLYADMVELELNGLDSNAEIFLNGRHLGAHRNAFRPWIADVKSWLREEENVLLVRLSAGVEDVPESLADSMGGVRASTEAGNGRPERGDIRRVAVRKPQYSFGWDWSPRVATTAIAGDVVIRAMNTACIRDVRLSPLKHGKEVLVQATITVDQFHYYKTAEGTVKLTLTDQDGRTFSAKQHALLRSGNTYVNLTIPIQDAKLWWPNGLGEQHLYRIETELVIKDQFISYPAFDYGIRFLDLDTDNKFAIVINGKKVFCKGADWIPADTIYARVTDEKYDALIREARDANFNMLRIWGGGLYEREAFYHACDHYGIMIWHDFMFACAPYPDHLEWFRSEVEKEADYQTRRLGKHACIALWCGSNENNWGFRDWWKEKTRGGAWTYNYLLPRIVEQNTPEIPYWNGSPYGGDEPNASDVGDRHHWGDCMMNPQMIKRITPEEYDLCTSLFVSEFGYIGACSKETTLAYLAAPAEQNGAAPERKGRVWQHHTNTFEKDTVEAGIKKHYADPDTLSFDDYVLYSGLCQGMMYSYALDSMRVRPNCHGGLFWMYEDCWGEVGWTIVDYYLRRKLSWYFVRRTFAPLRLIVRQAGGDQIRVVLANDTANDASFDLEYGYISLDGQVADLQIRPVQAPALERAELAVFDKDDHDPTTGLWIARVPDRADIPVAVFRAVDYRQLQMPRCTLRVMVKDGCTLVVATDVYAHGVHLTLPDGATPSDNYFDLLPGETQRIAISSAQSVDLAGIAVTCVNAA
ncbi:MAG: beta-mannosidase [Anaerolineae bacterium]|nr:beta-mannosidase [Anaerolineae bacterium]